MKKNKSIPVKTIALFLIVLIMLLPNISVYSSVGNYSANSSAIGANATYSQSILISNYEKACWPAVVAVAAGVGLAVVFVVGVIDGWNSVHPKAEYSIASNYNSNDFSKYDAQ